MSSALIQETHAASRPSAAQACGRGARERAGRKRLKPLFLLVFAACGTAKTTEHPPPPPAARQAPIRARPEPARPAKGKGLYSPNEALADVLSGELEYIGTGRWTGIERSWACAFRNRRVVVVDVYCGVSDSHTFRVDILSPRRGHVRIYAEAGGPITPRDRALYFTFTAGTEPPPGPATGIPRLVLTMSYEELRNYDQHRYEAFLPGCYGGEQHKQPVGGCLGTLASRKAEWTSRNRDFLEHASGDWYRVVHTLRSLAARYGRDPEGLSLSD